MQTIWSARNTRLRCQKSGNRRRIVCGLGWYLMRGYRASFQTQLAHFPSKNCDTAKDTEENADRETSWRHQYFIKKVRKTYRFSNALFIAMHWLFLGTRMDLTLFLGIGFTNNETTVRGLFFELVFWGDLVYQCSRALLPTRFLGQSGLQIYFTISKLFVEAWIAA